MKDYVRFLALPCVFDSEPSVLLHRHPLLPSKRDKTGLEHVVSRELLSATCVCVCVLFCFDLAMRQSRGPGSRRLLPNQVHHENHTTNKQKKNKQTNKQNTHTHTHTHTH